MRAARPAWLILGGLILLAAAVYLAAQEKVTFVYDDWYHLVFRRGFGADALLDPYNEHILIGPVAFYNVLLEGFGIDSARPVQVVSDLLVLACGTLLFAYARRRVGDWLALMGAALVLFFGSAWLDILWPVNLALSAGCAAGLGALLALDRDDRLGDRLATALLAVAVLFSEVGIAFAVGALVRVVLGERPWRRRLYVPLVPLALYAAWWLGWGHDADSSFSLGNLLSSPAYAFDAASQALAALLGLATPLSGDASSLVGLDAGRVALVVAAGLIALRLRGRQTPAGLWVALAAGLTFWLTAGFAENDLRPPTNSRILLPGGIFILLIAAEALKGVRPGRLAIAAAAVITALAVANNMRAFRDGSDVLESASAQVRADLAAVEATSALNPDFVLDRFPWLLPVSARDYSGVVRHYGSSPAYSEKELREASNFAQASADSSFAGALDLRLEAASGGGGPGCRTVRASPQPLPVAEFESGRLLFSDPDGGPRVLLARYSEDAWSVDLGPLPPGSSVLEVPADGASKRWLLGLHGEGTVRLCARSGQTA